LPNQLFVLYGETFIKPLGKRLHQQSREPVDINLDKAVPFVEPFRLAVLVPEHKHRDVTGRAEPVARLPYDVFVFAFWVSPKFEFASWLSECSTKEIVIVSVLVTVVRKGESSKREFSGRHCLVIGAKLSVWELID
jgi:hypothetical protein